jgi:hypothetical protein
MPSLNLVVACQYIHYTYTPNTHTRAPGIWVLTFYTCYTSYPSLLPSLPPSLAFTLSHADLIVDDLDADSLADILCAFGHLDPSPHHTWIKGWTRIVRARMLTQTGLGPMPGLGKDV